MDRKLKNVTLQQLEALVLLVENRSFSKAAKQMFMTQPSLTKHIRNLEEEVGAKVVDRKSRLLSPTTEGKVLYDYGKRMFRLVDEAHDRLEREREAVSGNIWISASTIPATYILPYVLRAFFEEQKDIRVHIRMNDSEKTIGMILDEEAEIGFIGMPVNHRKIHGEPLWRDELVLAVPKKHPFAQAASVSLDDLVREPFIARERGSATRAIFEECLAKRGEKGMSRFRVVCELGSSEAVKEAILAGIGVSVISVYAVCRELKEGTLAKVSIRECPLERHFHLIYRQHREFMPYHQVFMNFLRSHELEPHDCGPRRKK